MGRSGTCLLWGLNKWNVLLSVYESYKRGQKNSFIKMEKTKHLHSTLEWDDSISRLRSSQKEVVRASDWCPRLLTGWSDWPHALLLSHLVPCRTSKPLLKGNIWNCEGSVPFFTDSERIRTYFKYQSPTLSYTAECQIRIQLHTHTSTHTIGFTALWWEHLPISIPINDIAMHPNVWMIHKTTD